MSGSIAFMRNSTPNSERRILVKCPDAQARYDEKSVLFHLERDGKLVSVKGRFIIHLEPDSDSAFIDIEFRGHIEHFEPPDTFGYCFHLSQAHTDSIVSVSSQQPDVDFEVTVPLLFSHYIR
jgi:hypothetical protein